MFSSYSAVSRTSADCASDASTRNVSSPPSDATSFGRKRLPPSAWADWSMVDDGVSNEAEMLETRCHSTALTCAFDVEEMAMLAQPGGCDATSTWGTDRGGKSMLPNNSFTADNDGDKTPPTSEKSYVGLDTDSDCFYPPTSAVAPETCANDAKDVPPMSNTHWSQVHDRSSDTMGDDAWQYAAPSNGRDDGRRNRSCVHSGGKEKLLLSIGLACHLMEHRGQAVVMAEVHWSAVGWLLSGSCDTNYFVKSVQFVLKDAAAFASHGRLQSAILSVLAKLTYKIQPRSANDCFAFDACVFRAAAVQQGVTYEGGLFVFNLHDGFAMHFCANGVVIFMGLQFAFGSFVAVKAPLGLAYRPYVYWPMKRPSIAVRGYRLSEHVLVGGILAVVCANDSDAELCKVIARQMAA